MEQAVTQAEYHGLYLPAVEVAVGDASEMIESINGAMASVKPPDEPSQMLREQVLDLLDRAEEAGSSARIALQRGRLQDAVKAAEEAGPLADELEAMSKELEK
jgi:phage shock protein A